MQRFCFFCDFSELQPQTSANAFGPVDADHWRVTATLGAVNPPSAFAVTDGTVFVQRSATSGRLNLLLVPANSPAFLDTPIKYIVYRGIMESSLAEAGGLLKPGDGLLQRMADCQAATNSALASALSPRIELLGTEVPDPVDTSIDTLLGRSNVELQPYARPAVRVGDFLGSFATDSVSIEIVLADPPVDFTLDGLRAAENVLAVSTPSGASVDARRFSESMQREQLLCYLDPCHFFTPLWSKNVLEFPPGSSPNLATWIATWHTSTFAYLDIRNEHDRSLNFYRNYGPDLDTLPTLRVQRTGESPEVVSYATQGWPLLRADLSAGDFDPVRVQLPIGDNGSTRVQVTSPRVRRVVSVQPSVDPGFTTPIQLPVPRQAPVWLPSLFKIRYHRPLSLSDPATGANYRPPIGHRLDNLLDLTVLDVQPPPPSSPYLSALRSRQRLVFIDRSPPAGGGHPAWLSTAVDEFGVYLFAFRAGRKLIEPSNPMILARGRQIAADPRAAEMLPIADLPRLTIDSNGTTVRVTDTAAIHNDFVGVAMTRGEFDLLTADLSGALPTQSLARLHLQAEDPLPGGIHVFTLAVSSAHVVDGDLQTAAPSPLADGPRFYSVESDPGFLFSNEYISGLPAGESNHDDMLHSFILPDNRITIRKSPEVDLITTSDFNAAGDESNLNETHHNVIGQCTGLSRVSITVLGQHVDPEDNRWFRIKLLEQTELIRPLSVPSNYEESLRATLNKQQIPIAGQTFKVGAGTIGWVREDPAVILVASFGKFERDLRGLLEKLRTHHPDDTKVDLMTRVRMLTKERGLAFPNERLLSRMFDIIIGTVEPDDDDDLVATVQPDRGLDDDILREDPKLETVHGETLNTTLSLFTDYMATHLEGDTIIDLHHLFVGLDVARGQTGPVERRIGTQAFDYAIGLPIVPSGLFPEHILPDAVAAALWVGDVGACFSHLAHHRHGDYEADWTTDNGPDSPDRDAAFRKHYFNALAPDHDLFPDVLAYRLAGDLKRKSRAADTPGGALLEVLRALRHELRTRGGGDYLHFFEQDLRRKAPSSNVVEWIDTMMVNFSQVFEIRTRLLAVKDNLPTTPGEFADLADVATLPPEVLAAIDEAVRVHDESGAVRRLAFSTQFIDWFEARSGITLLDGP